MRAVDKEDCTALLTRPNVVPDSSVKQIEMNEGHSLHRVEKHTYRTAIRQDSSFDNERFHLSLPSFFNLLSYPHRPFDAD